MNTRPDPTGRARRVHVRGFITSAGFAEGHRFVVGCWPDSPVGPICDVMWATPENERILLVPSDVAGEFITSIYQFDAVRTGPLHVECDGVGVNILSGVEFF